jgi:branched-chain amino acid transport system ATP-binding protein
VVYHAAALALRGVSLEVPEGEIVALLGPNGAGKTTVLRAITGLLAVHGGKVTGGGITLEGASLLQRRPDEMAGLGISQVMEGRRILAPLTVEENLRAAAYGAADRRRAHREIDELYQRFPILVERRHQPAGYLSGGEQQMLAVARALVSRPRLLLIDEPSLGLAPKIVADVARLIAEIHEQGVSILLVEQNAAMALELAARGFVLDRGRVTLEGTAAQLRAEGQVREAYLGIADRREPAARAHERLYRRRQRWLS